VFRNAVLSITLREKIESQGISRAALESRAVLFALEMERALTVITNVNFPSMS